MIFRAESDSGHDSPSRPKKIPKMQKHRAIQRRLAWPLRKDDTHKSRSVNNFLAVNKSSDKEGMASDDREDNEGRNCYDTRSLVVVTPKGALPLAVCDASATREGL